MAGNFISAPVEATKNAAVFGGRIIKNLGEGAMHQVQPNYVPPEIARKQQILKNKKFNFGVIAHSGVGGVYEAFDLEQEIDLVKHSGMAAEGAVLEVRPFMSQEDMFDPGLIHSLQRTVVDLQKGIQAETRADAVMNAHPIIPSSSIDTSVAAARTWGGIAAEFSGLDHQFRTTNPRRIGLLAIGPRRTIAESFGEHLDDDLHLPIGGLATLHKVGDRPADNMVYPVVKL